MLKTACNFQAATNYCCNFKQTHLMTVLESEFHEIFGNAIKKTEFRLRRWLTSWLFNFESIKLSFWPPGGHFFQILISAIDF